MNVIQKNKDRKNIYQFIFSVIFIFLPLFFYRSSIIFLCAFFVLFLLILINRNNNAILKTFECYVLAASLFGISFLGIKIYDIVLIFVFIFLLISSQLKTIYNTLFLFLIFLFIAIGSTLLFGNNYVENKSAVQVQILRYFFAALAFWLFSQECYGKIDKTVVVKFLDYFSILMLGQTMMMMMCAAVFPVSHNFSGSIFLVNLYGNTNLLNGANQVEARATAFFSDPNKLMCFMFLLLLIRRTISQEKIFTLKEIPYMLTALITGSRVAFICVGFFVLYVLSLRIFFKNNLLAFLSLVGIFAISYIILMLNNITIGDLLNNISDSILKLMGRQRTLNVNSNLADDNRVQIWKYAFQYIPNHIFVGNGLASETILLPYPTHNTYVYLLLNTGCIGLISYVMWLFKAAYRILRLDDFIFFILIPTFFLDLTDYNMLFFSLGFILAYKNYRGINESFNSRAYA